MKSFRSKPVGWRGESYRHYLAQKGIPTKKKYFALFTPVDDSSARLKLSADKELMISDALKDIDRKRLESKGEVAPTMEDLDFMMSEMPEGYIPKGLEIVQASGRKLAGKYDNAFKHGGHSSVKLSETSGLTFPPNEIEDEGKKKVATAVLLLPRKGGTGDTFIDTMMHEQGHVVDPALRVGVNGDKPVSRVDVVQEEVFDPKKALTQYGTTSKYEDFAEAFRLANRGGIEGKKGMWRNVLTDVADGEAIAAEVADFTQAKKRWRPDENAIVAHDVTPNISQQWKDKAKEKLADIKEREQFIKKNFPAGKSAREIIEERRTPQALIAEGVKQAEAKGYLAKKVDLKKYAGTWKQVSVKPEPWFQRGLKKVTATYKVRADGDVDVINKGYKDGKLKVAKGRATSVSSDNRMLAVSFAPFGLFPAPYKIEDIDEGYRNATVRSGKYVWHLKR